MPERDGRKLFFAQLKSSRIPLNAQQMVSITGLWRKMEKLKHGSTGYPDSMSFVFTVAGIKTFTQLKNRLSAEVSFYHQLYAPDPKGRFKVIFKPEHRWPDGIITDNVIAFHCPSGNEVGYTAFKQYPENILVMDFVQGRKERDMRAANQLLGRPWHEVFMERVLQAYKPMHRLGFRFLQRIETRENKRTLARVVRDRWFARQNDPHIKDAHELNFNRQRVRRILRPK